LRNFNKSTWSDAILDIGRTCLDNKFEQNPVLRDFLVKTNPKNLYEASPRDFLWGIGHSLYDPDLIKKEKDWGKNILGKTLEEIRRKYR
jgi:ribA/ribD-fused uncharacterized protein